MIYCNRADIELVFGAINISKWADLDNNEDADTIQARIENACETASAEIEDIFRNRQYSFPLTQSPTLKNLVVRLAGLKLHDARGIIDGDSTDSLSLIRQEWEKTVARIRLGEMILPGNRTSNTPKVVPAETPNIGIPDPFAPFFTRKVRHG